MWQEVAQQSDANDWKAANGLDRIEIFVRRDDGCASSGNPRCRCRVGRAARRTRHSPGDRAAAWQPLRAVTGGRHRGNEW